MGVIIRIGGFILFHFLSTLGLSQLNSGSEDPLNIRGRIVSDVSTNSVSGIDRRQDPFNIRLNGSLLINTYGWSTSLQFNISDNRTIRRINFPDIELPSYHLIGISPSYKWAKFHLGFRAMEFSKYALSGHSFSGIGLELSPGKIRVQAMYGRLKRASAEMLDIRQSIDPQYERMGWGLKVGYKNNDGHFHTYLFQAEDRLESLDLQSYAPHNNSIIGFQMHQSIGPAIVDVDYAYSGFTRDSRAEQVDLHDYGILEKGFGFFSPNASTEYRSALTAKATFKTSLGNIYASFERVDPGYRTMGALFFNNDFENLTLGGQVRLSSSTMLSLNGGFQRNNLENEESNSLNRLVISAQMSIRPSDRSTLNISYSNFRTTNTLYAVAIPFIQVDSIQLSLVNQQASINFQSFINRDRTTSVNGYFAYFRSHSIENDVVNTHQKLNNLTAFINYNRRIIDSGLIFNGGLQLNRNTSPVLNILTIGPTLMISKNLMSRKLKVAARLSYISIYLNSQYDRAILHPGLRMSYDITNDQELVLDCRMIHQQSQLNNLSDFTELYTRLMWQARF